MSRFPELFEEAVEGVVQDDAFLVEDLAEHVARRVVDRQDALLAEVRITARYPYERRTPVTKLATQEMVSLIGIAAASRERVRRVVGVEATGINACPCAQGLVRGAAADRLLEAGFEDGDVERILELVPLATHNQRGRGTLLVGTARARSTPSGSWRSSRASMSSPIYELLKRPDELFVVEHAHLQPRFVEDSVRVALKSVLDELPGSATPTSSSRASSTSRRSTPTRSWPSATARSGSCGRNSRAATATARPRTRSCGTGCARSVAPPAPQLEAALLSPGEPPDVRAVEEDDGGRGERAERDHRPRVAEQPRPDGERGSGRHRRDRRVARHARRRRSRRPRRLRRRAARRRGTRRRSSRPSSRPSGSRGRAAARGRASRPRPRARPRAGRRRRVDDERRHEPLRRVEQRRPGTPYRGPYDAPDVRSRRCCRCRVCGCPRA